MELLTEIFYVEELLLKKISEEPLTAAEQTDLDTWINECKENDNLYRELISRDLLKAALQEFAEPDTEAGLKKMRQELFPKTPIRKKTASWLKAMRAVLVRKLTTLL